MESELIEVERGLSPEQYNILLRPLNGQRVANRSQGGKTLSYLEAWDVRAHLIRCFGFGNFDIDVVDQAHVNTRTYESSGNSPRPMVEVSWMAKVRLTVRDPQGFTLCTYTDCAVGSTSGPDNMIGEHHDNAVKTATSDALKRCAMNLGTQFGLSLYDNGATGDVVKRTLAPPPGWVAPVVPTDAEAEATLTASLGARPAGATTTEGQES